MCPYFIQVTVDIRIINLLQVNGVDATIKLVTEVAYTWYDELLRWDPKDFYNLTTIIVPLSKVWRPDIACTQTCVS